MDEFPGSLTEEYRGFLAAKAPRAQASGIAATPMRPALFDFQRLGVEFALRQGRAAVFFDAGLGKGLIELEFATQAAAASNGCSLILTPLSVARRLEREAVKFGYENVRVVRDASEVRPGINICNYDRLDQLEPSAFGCVVLDECFAKGTGIDTPSGRKHIENIRPGDYILNCNGVDQVSDVHQREVPYAVLVKIAGTSFISSPNHPVFTQRGWVGAQHLRPGDHALATGAAMRLVRDGVLSEVSISVCAAVLREVLLSEMADDAEGSPGEGAFSGSGCQAREEEGGLACVRSTRSDSRVGENNESQANIEAGGSSQDFGRVESHEARTVRAWGQWSRDDVAASVNDGCSWARMGSGISVITGPKEARIPDLLQARLRQSETESRGRGGWSIALRDKETGGPEAGRDDTFIRVDGIEILEPRDHRLDELRDVSGKLYFYDLGATRHPSYSVNGCLVHNSSVLKSFAGKTTRALIEAFAHTPFRLAATATPAPNDHMELGTHAEFLGVMAQSEMLIRWFLNDTSDTGTWRLKGHATQHFWDWVSSWAIMAERPEDLGCDGSRFELPPLNVIRHRVQADIKPMAGELFARDISAIGIHALKRQTADARAARVADILGSTAQRGWIIWCDTDYEQDAVARMLPGTLDVRGSLAADRKEQAVLDFIDGRSPVLLSKPSIFGYGMNFQHCAQQIFVGRSFSYETWYQAVRRSWRFGQTRPVDIHLMVAEGEDQIGRVIDRKAEDHIHMKQAMRAATARAMSRGAQVRVRYVPSHIGRMPSWLV